MTEGPSGATFDVPGYRIRQRIGRGGFAVVYEAEQLSLGRAVAVKMLLPDLATERDLYRFERERLLLSELSRHRHVVDVIDAGTTTDGHPFIVMRLYRRGSLAQALTDSGPFWPADVVSIVGKLASALQAAHNLGVVHRDIKPENVLIADDGEPALADFGISVLTGPGHSTTGNVFTMAHVAPEVLHRAEYGVASDIYSLASTAYQLLAGRCAFSGGNQFAQMRAIVEDPVPPIGRADVPPELESVIVRGMAKQPQERYPSAIAFGETLAAAWRASAWTATVSALPGLPEGPWPTEPAQALVTPPDSGIDRYHTEQLDDAAASYRLEPTEPTEPTELTAARRRRWMAAGVGTVALAVPVVLAATYALDLPPGSAMRSQVGTATVPTVVLASDMSRQGFSDGDNPTNRAVELYLSSIGNRAGRHRVRMRPYDVATPQLIHWDAATCRSVAQQHLAKPEEVGVIGPYNSGCAKIMAPILSAGDGGPLAMVSNGATDPGLTRRWDVGEPDKYYPKGLRAFARVVTTDDVQGKAAASFARDDLKVTKVFVLNDGAVYGKHIARTFVDAARDAGITVVGEAQWKRSDADYGALFARVKAAGADAVFLGGSVANNGARVVQDKVSVLGDNTGVKLLTADGFVGEPKFAALPQAQGMYLTFPGLSAASIRLRGGAGSDFLNAYQKRYGKDPDDPYTLYGVAAAQVLITAIKVSDGTRAGVHAALFRGAGVTVPEAESVLGRPTRIDPATGDVSIKDVTVEVIKRDVETFETVVEVR